MFQNVYLRERDNRRIPSGLWPTREIADRKAALNEASGFRRVEVIEHDPCETCEGTGTVAYYVGTFGTLSCSGEAERPCEDCGGYGVV